MVIPIDKIAIFASGTGSNAKKIIQHCSDIPEIEIAMVLSNRPNAKVLQTATENNIPTKVLDRNTFYQSSDLVEELKKAEIDWLILAGFLWLVPPYLIEAYPNKILNIHPALLPKFGGKGMYGARVHQAVFEANQQQSGPTIHYVNAHYDEGAIIFQATCQITPTDQPEDIAKKVLQLEHQYYPIVIESLIKKNRSIKSTKKVLQ